MSVKAPFQPAASSGVIVTPAAASAAVTIGLGNKNVCFTNLGANVCYVRCGLAGITASTADYPVLPNSQIVLGKDQDHNTVAHISASGTSLSILPGEGW
jgi:hypothetical protein